MPGLFLANYKGHCANGFYFDYDLLVAPDAETALNITCEKLQNIERNQRLDSLLEIVEVEGYRLILTKPGEEPNNSSELRMYSADVRVFGASSADFSYFFLVAHHRQEALSIIMQRLEKYHRQQQERRGNSSVIELKLKDCWEYDKIDGYSIKIGEKVPYEQSCKRMVDPAITSDPKTGKKIHIVHMGIILSCPYYTGHYLEEWK